MPGETSADQPLIHFIRDQAFNIIQCGSDANYSLSTIGIGQGGSLSEALVDARKTAIGIGSENVDFHNPFKPTHGFDFRHRAQDGLVAIDLGHHGFAPGNPWNLPDKLN